MMEEEPPRLRKLDPSIPRDLETVIQKAIAREPTGRYATAGALAEDLSLFLDDKPVRARDIGTLERSWKWARRRPVTAALLGGLVVAVIVGLTAVTWQWLAAVGARDEARIARDEARGNLKAAAKAVDTFFTKMSEEYLLNEPGMQPLRMKLLKLAPPYYQDFAARSKDDPALRVVLANAYLNWGMITGEIGSTEESRTILQTAVTHFASLCQTDPTDLEAQRGLARSYQSLAQQSLLGDFRGEGFLEARQAAELWEALIRVRRNDAEARRLLGRSYDLAGVLRSSVDLNSSEQYFEKAIVVLSEARKDFPSDALIQQRLAVAISNISTLYLIKGEPGRAEISIGRSLEILSRLRDANPSSNLLQKDLARTFRNRGQTRMIFGSRSGAGDDLEEALRIVESLVKKNPDVSDYRHILGETYTYLGQIRLDQGLTLRTRELLSQAIVWQRELFEQHPNMIQNTLTLFESRYILATLERESGRVEDAQTTLDDTLRQMKKQFEAAASAMNRRIYFQVLLESTLIECSRGGDATVKLGPLERNLREQETSLQANPEDSVVRCAAVASALALFQFRPTTEAPDLSLEKLNRAAGLIAPGLRITPEHPRLRCLNSGLEMMRGGLLHRAGKTAEASAAAKDAVAIAGKLAGEDSAYLYDLACALALQAGFSPSEPGPAAAALDALRKAVECGFDNVYKLKNDENLAPVRQRKDFQSLVDDTERKSAQPQSVVTKAHAEFSHGSSQDRRLAFVGLPKARRLHGNRSPLCRRPRACIVVVPTLPWSTVRCASVCRRFLLFSSSWVQAGCFVWRARSRP